jgi:hypothetical protein
MELETLGARSPSAILEDLDQLPSSSGKAVSVAIMVKERSKVSIEMKGFCIQNSPRYCKQSLTSQGKASLW